jgi:hypothetical protein
LPDSERWLQKGSCEGEVERNASLVPRRPPGDRQRQHSFSDNAALGSRRYPRRLLKRYVLLNPLYLRLLLLSKVGVHTLDPEATITPVSEIRYG